MRNNVSIDTSSSIFFFCVATHSMIIFLRKKKIAKLQFTFWLVCISIGNTRFQITQRLKQREMICLWQSVFASSSLDWCKWFFTKKIDYVVCWMKTISLHACAPGLIKVSWCHCQPSLGENIPDLTGVLTLSKKALAGVLL